MNNNFKRIIIASDHAGVNVKAEIIKHLENHCQLIDIGPKDENTSVNYAQYGIACAQQVVEFDCLGIVVCGTGIGISIAANKVPGIRCAIVYNIATAQAAKVHNNANMIAIGARQFDIETILSMVDAWLNAEFEGERHLSRLETISNFEKNNSK
ncbi:MAG: RpiB/LacA/LacB family sugar-phosphate isomerase [Mycoplasma sp.]